MDEQKRNVLASWDFEPKDEKIRADSIAGWLIEFDKNIDFRKAVAALYDIGFYNGQEATMYHFKNRIIEK